MRISTAQMFSQTTTSILQKQTAAAKSLDQLSSGKKISTSGEDPVAALAIDNLRQENALVEQYMKNIDYATNRLGLAESSLGGAEDVAFSARDLILRAANGALTDNERQTIADELQSNLDQLLAIANSQDESGSFLFAGFNNETQPFAFNNSGDMVYQGDAGVRQALVARGVSVGSNIPGDLAFMQAPNAMGDYSVNYLTGQQGDFRVTSASIANTGAYTAESPDTYGFAFSDNGAGGIAVQITGGSGTTWNIDPVDPAAPLSFNGLEVRLSAVPAAGDSFSLEPQSEVSIFDSMSQAISLMRDEARFTSLTGKAELAQILNNYDSGLEQLGNARGLAGNGLKSLESNDANHAELQLVNSSALSLLEDLDYASAISEFEKQQLALNAVSNVFGKVNGTSLFDYI
ncbi:flagellar hook-associated protein FlgL [Shewanella sedimentimangrovi]|uniref:Flagellar hook-associated protein FlgL n=1 Tax=Shewanella sedimentimangrovi TaxID=2814293 RepID=A0ABX7QYS0_9GAMM|nr:flagellar hook-associated protein FlgL [Shewanella sedimentimangrovi]QSX36086.1 flagellar hook-associated protein FlgL [Shewanella sedimentimangrovi]